jgi:hypothetical protein
MNVLRSKIDTDKFVAIDLRNRSHLLTPEQQKTLALFWTPFRHGENNGVAAIVKRNPKKTLEERAKKKIVSYISGLHS